MNLSVSVLNSFPQVDEKAVDELLEAEIAQNRKKIVVLDDDPTGVQTVHDISVITGWDPQLLEEAFREEKSLFYILTNSRGLTAAQTSEIHHQIAANVDEAARRTGKQYLFISRSDSTLRGHYPLETTILKEEYSQRNHLEIDGEILCPFFKEGGRFTIDDVHYVRYGDELVNAADTEFARDKTFGYRALSMPEYIEEKTGGAYKKEDVVCISLDDLRALNYEKIENQLLQVKDFNKIIVNAIDYVDVKIFCVALYRAMAKGKMFMLRTAAGIVKVMGGISDKELLRRKDMIVKENPHGGIIVAGSHTNKTTAQLKELEKLDNLKFIELDATLVKDEPRFAAEVERCLKEENDLLEQGINVCCYTSRKLITADSSDREDDLKLAVRISEAVQQLVGRLKVEPAFIIAKGGITSSDIGIKALKVRKANVLGQIRPGIPVWQTGPESLFPKVPYVIFPGNVGDDATLKEAVEILSK